MLPPLPVAAVPEHVVAALRLSLPSSEPVGTALGAHPRHLGVNDVNVGEQFRLPDDAELVEDWHVEAFHLFNQKEVGFVGNRKRWKNPAGTMKKVVPTVVLPQSARIKCFLSGILCYFDIDDDNISMDKNSERDEEVLYPIFYMKMRSHEDQATLKLRWV
ncbi:hypothetical protein GUJ93_ZPchr0012g21780 [Zizania palustris]|uniref:Uncharacterized protein n=1 Tax=Zizania palustris TaxID=103762 RepID=A0A8J5WQ79_ZIZPA|nr:hypothetical protein GUJ93_ZPchr0012g21780 [Zizania palustris]